jgi:hypothetical protein
MSVRGDKATSVLANTVTFSVRSWMCLCIRAYIPYEHTDFDTAIPQRDRLCGLVVRVPGYRFIDPCSIPGTTRFYEK